MLWDVESARVAQNLSFGASSRTRKVNEPQVVAARVSAVRSRDRVMMFISFGTSRVPLVGGGGGHGGSSVRFAATDVAACAGDCHDAARPGRRPSPSRHSERQTQNTTGQVRGQRADILWWTVWVEWALLAPLPAAIRERVLQAARRRRYSRGEVIFHEGDLGDTVHLVQAGRLAVRVSTEAGESVTVRILRPGEAFGELSSLRRWPD